MAVLRFVLALTAAVVAGLAVHLFRGFPLPTAVITAFSVGALTYVAVQTLERLAPLFRRTWSRRSRR